MKSANRPEGSDVTLDHSGHFVADARAARAALVDLGFTVTPYSAQVQPDPATGKTRLTGTGNVCVMLKEGYMEFLVRTADTQIGREFQTALDRRAGLHLSAFGVADAKSRHAALQKAGREMRPLVHFSRAIETAEASATVAFTVARMADGAMPEGRVQFLTHHSVDAMWQARWTDHANGAKALKSMVISAPDPAEAARRFSQFLGRSPQTAGTGLNLVLDQGTLEFLSEAEATALLGIAVESGRACFAALRVSVAELSPFRACRGARDVGDGVVGLPFPHALGRGCWLFEQSG